MLKELFVKRYISLSSILLALFMLLMQNEQIGAKINEQTNNESEEVNRLILVLRDEWLKEHEPEQVTKAIERLGELKATAAIEDLVQLLTFKHRFEHRNDELGFQFPYYPAVNALSQIGRPSLSALTRVIENNESGSFGKKVESIRVFDNGQDNSLASDKAIIAILDIFRENPAKAVKHLKKAAEKASTSIAQQRLLDAAERVEEFRSKTKALVNMKFKNVLNHPQASMVCRGTL